MRLSLIIALLLTLAAAALCVDLPAPYANEPAPGTEIVSPTDGAIMVWVPSGYFTMGMDRDRADKVLKELGYPGGWEDGWAWEWAPERKVYVPGFFIDKYEVTWRLWRQFVAANPEAKIGCKLPEEKVENEYALYPATTVYWADAAKYANWAGKALPYEAQWEKAARGTDGRTFPWGEELPTHEHGKFVDLQTRRESATLCAMVGSFPKGASSYGCQDMAGNVMEWTSEWMEIYPNNPYREKMLHYFGHANGVLRGGSFYFGPAGYIAAKRFGFEHDEAYYHVGFRTVWTPPEDYFTTKAFDEAKAKVPAAKAELEKLRAIGKPGGLAL